MQYSYFTLFKPYSSNKQPAILESFSTAQGPGHNWARGMMEKAVSDILGHLQKVLMETGGQPISHLVSTFREFQYSTGSWS